MAFSQRDEEIHILNYFKDKKGTFLDLGAFHPFVFSNVRALYELGWKGTLIEPAKENFENIHKEYKDDLEVDVIQTCVGTYDGEIDFWDSNGDAVSSTDIEHVEKWQKGYNSVFTQYKSRVVTFNTLIQETQHKRFNFINLDVEGTNWEILQNIDLALVGCEMLCIEFDNKGPEIRGYMQARGYTLIHQTSENMIFAI